MAKKTQCNWTRLIMVIVLILLAPLSTFAYTDDAWGGTFDLKYTGVLKVNEFNSSTDLETLLNYEMAKEFNLKVNPDEEMTFIKSVSIPDHRWQSSGTEQGSRHAIGELSLKGRLFGYTEESRPDVIVQVFEGEATFQMTLTTGWDGSGIVGPSSVITTLDYSGPFFIILTDLFTGEPLEKTELVFGNTFAYLHGNYYKPVTVSLSDFYPGFEDTTPVNEVTTSNRSDGTTVVDTYKPALPYVLFGDIENQGKLSRVDVVIDTKAGETAGETSVDVPSLIIEGTDKSGDQTGLGVGIGVAVLGGLIGLAGAGIASQNQANQHKRKQNDAKNSSNTYQMRIRKDFGNKIKYDGAPLPIYARMVEIGQTGQEIERPDLTAQIDIFSDNSVLKVGPASIAGAYKSADLVAKSTSGPLAAEGIVSFRFTGEGGTFQNNVAFTLVGEPSLVLNHTYSDMIFLQAGSEKAIVKGINLVDFMADATVTLVSKTESGPFDAQISRDATGKQLLNISNHSEKKEKIETFYETYQVELLAENPLEQAHKIIRIILCNEGLLPDFHGDKLDVKGYFDPKTERMAETVVDFKLGLWDEASEELVFHVPDNLAFTYSDEARICDLIGLKAEKDLDCADKTVIRYRLMAEKPFPNKTPISGELMAACNHDGQYYGVTQSIPLMPDILEFDKNATTEKEYQNCLYMIKNYLPEGQAQKLQQELESNRQLNLYGAEDYRVYRQYVWNRAQYYIMTEKRDYMREAAYYDDMIKLAEWTVWLGDIALEIALMPIGGPLVTFVLKNAKGLLVTYVNARQTKGAMDLSDVMAYISSMLGGLDDITTGVPGPTEYKKLAIWLSCYFIYRLFYNRACNKDTDSWSESIIQAFKELGIKTILAEFVARKVGSADDHSHLNVSNGKEITYNTYQDAALMKPLTDIGDNVVDALDQQTTTLLNRLYTYLDDIVEGKVG